MPPQIHRLEIVEPIPIQNIPGRETLILKCSSSSYPVPTIEWAFNGKKITADEDQETEGNSNNNERRERGNKQKKYEITGTAIEKMLLVYCRAASYLFTLHVEYSHTLMPE